MLFSREGPWPEEGNKNRHSPRAVPRYLRPAAPPPRGQCNYQGLFSSFPFNRSVCPSELLVAGRRSRRAIGPLTPSEGT